MFARRRLNAWWIVAAVVLLVGSAVLGAMIGPAGGISSANWDIIWNIRLPRVVLAGIVGAMLSLSGASYQGVFRNPLVDPYLLGAAAGAGLGATLVFAYGRTATSGWPVDPLPLAPGFAQPVHHASQLVAQPVPVRRQPPPRRELARSAAGGDGAAAVHVKETVDDCLPEVEAIVGCRNRAVAVDVNITVDDTRRAAGSMRKPRISTGSSDGSPAPPAVSAVRRRTASISRPRSTPSGRARAGRPCEGSGICYASRPCVT